MKTNGRQIPNTNFHGSTNRNQKTPTTKYQYQGLPIKESENTNYQMHEILEQKQTCGIKFESQESMMNLGINLAYSTFFLLYYMNNTQDS